MSKSKPKFWIASKYTNHIKHRTLSVFEERNMKMFEMSNSLHLSWQEAHQAILAYRQKELDDAIAKLTSRNAAYRKAMSMKAPS